MSAWTVIAHTEVGSGGVANIEFGSISGSYTDLALVSSLRSTDSAATSAYRLQFNGSTANFTVRGLYGIGNAQDSFTETNYGNETNTAATTSNTFSNNIIYIPNYSSSNAKSFGTDGVTENNGTTAMQMITAGRWNVTDAITTIRLTPAVGSFVQYSSATLYGITKGSSGGVTVS